MSDALSETERVFLEIGNHAMWYAFTKVTPDPCFDHSNDSLLLWEQTYHYKYDFFSIIKIGHFKAGQIEKGDIFTDCPLAKSNVKQHRTHIHQIKAKYQGFPYM